MEGIVTKLFDIDQIVFPDGMFDVSVDEEEIDAKVALLSLKYAAEAEVGTAEEGDILFCVADSQSYPDGRTVILYTGSALPGAEDASQKAVGRSVGDAFEAVLAEKTVTLTVKRIIRRTGVEVNDGLIASLAIENVATVEAYRDYLRTQLREDMLSERSKAAIQFSLETLVNGSEYSYDEKEMDAYVQALLQPQLSELEEMGIEMSVEELQQISAMRVKQGWVAKAYCDAQGIELDLSGMDEEIDGIMEMQALMGDTSMTREEYVTIFTENQYLAKLFDALNAKIASAMEG